MKTIILILSISSLTARAQSNCNLDKIETFVYNVDSLEKIRFYYNDEKNYIAIYKDNKDELVKELFKLKFVSAKSLLNLTKMLGAPMSKIDSITFKTNYYSVVDNKYISIIKNIWVLERASEISRTKNKFVISLKVGSGQFDQNFELEYTMTTIIPKYAKTTELLKNAKLTCIKQTGTDF